jgi:thiamine-monophosphate kinase
MTRAGHGEIALLEAWLERFDRAGAGVIVGPGDDAAVLRATPGKVRLVTTDALVEGVHFDLRYAPPMAVGRKALGVNLSDIAAMGGTPRALFCSLVVPGRLAPRILLGVADGLARACREATLPLAGGNISAGPRLELHLTLIGEADPKAVLRRDGASPGESLWVSGTLGDAALGLRRLRERQAPPRRPTHLERRHLLPTPRLSLGRALGAGRIATACIDLSDGLALDLRRLAEASGVGARVALSRLPLSRPARRDLAGLDDPWALPLCGGEDYELLFTVPADRVARLERRARRLGVPVTCIGETTAGGGVAFVPPDGAPYRPPLEGYEHRFA